MLKIVSLFREEDNPETLTETHSKQWPSIIIVFTIHFREWCPLKSPLSIYTENCEVWDTQKRHQVIFEHSLWKDEKKRSNSPLFILSPTGEEHSLDVIHAFDDINKAVRSLASLPLGIHAVQGTHPVFRHCDVSIVNLHAKQKLYTLPSPCRICIKFR